jgi:hypothetical protein
MRALFLSLVLLFTVIHQTTFGQYFNIHTWESFENGSVPSTLSYWHHADQQSVTVFPYGIPGTPKEMLTDISSFECGKFGLGFFPTEEKRQLSLVSGLAMDRARLGAVGHALFQADFFLPAEGQHVPNQALLAIREGPQSTDGTESTFRFDMYRFGILEGGKNVFFSFQVNEQEQPVLYEQQLISDFKLQRPGWHRFQIIFKGPQEIYCCIDRVQTKFSPIRETTHMRLKPGLMVSYLQKPAPCVADNLSIQWSPEEVPLPDSPWIPRRVTKETNLLSDGSPLPWFTNPSQAWTVSSAQKRPLLVMFYSPKMNPYKYLLSICPNDAKTSTMLERHVLARVDANQLWGAALAQKLGVVRIPTLIVMGPDGREVARAEVVRGQTKWDDVMRGLWPGEAAFQSQGQ